MITFILNEAPYGSENSYNALRLALSLVKQNQSIQVFLMADAVFCSLRNQNTPAGYYNIGRMIKGLIKRNVRVHTCGTCTDARGISEDQFIDGVIKSDLNTLTQWVMSSSQTINF